MQIVFEAIIGIAILSFLIIIHELGHFILARAFGVKVDEFGLGFPFLGRIVKFKRGETIYSINWLFFGGFVQLHGEESGSKVNDPRSFSAQNVWKRYLISSAGVVVNIVFAVLVFTILLAFTGFKFDSQQTPFPNKFPFGTQSTVGFISYVEPKSIAESVGFKAGDKVISVDGKTLGSINDIETYTSSKINQNVQVVVQNLNEKSYREINVTPIGSNFGLVTSIVSGSPADKAGFKQWDKILTVDGKSMTSADEIRTYTKDKAGQNITFTVQNLTGSSSREISVTPRKNPPAGEGALGITLEQGAPLSAGAYLEERISVAYTSLPEKVFVGFLHSGNMLELQWAGLKSFFSQSIQQGSIEPLAANASGPVRIVAVLGVLVQNSGAEFLRVIATLAALISLMLGIGNLLPIPALDGGRMFILFIEGVFHKKVKAELENKVTSISFLILCLLLVVITANDIFRMVTGHLFG